MIRRVAACIGLAALVLILVFDNAPEQDIVTQVGIAASPAEVWAVLIDTADYPAWSPNMRLTGRLERGQVIEYAQGQGADRMVFHPVVLVARPNEELRWFGQMWFPGVFDAVHFFQLAPCGGGTRLTQGEHVRGAALWLFDARQLLPSFNAMNAAIMRRTAAIAHPARAGSLATSSSTTGATRCLPPPPSTAVSDPPV